MTTNPILHSLSLLTPYDIDIPKVRIGPETDGGYVFADRFSPSQAVISYGISTEYRFDEIMARRGHQVFMFDHTIGSINRTHEGMRWFQEGVAGKSDPAAALYSIEDHLARHAIEGHRIILKMDVEGAEYDAFAHMSDHVLDRLEQVVVEIHDVHHLTVPAFREKFDAALGRLNSVFTLFHVHANNCDGHNGIVVIDGFPVSYLLELSFIRSNLVQRRPSRTLYPSALDYPNVPQRDKLLWFFPFLPTTISQMEFASCLAVVEAR